MANLLVRKGKKISAKFTTGGSWQGEAKKTLPVGSAVAG
jgi:hypothetical protein